MQLSWHPRFKVGDAVRVLSCDLPGKVTGVDYQQSAYIVEISGNSQFRLLCTEDDLRPAPSVPRVPERGRG
jgi:hypothetical protein